MSFPYIFESNFESGDNSEWDSEADTGALLDFPHYTDLAKIPGMAVPFRGAYCMRIAMGDTNDHTVTEGDINIADAASSWVRFYLYLHTDVAATADDIFNIFEWQQAGGTVEAVISLQITAATDLVDIAIADGTEASSGFTALSKGKWHLIEALFTVDVTPGTNGVLTLFVDKLQVQTVISHNQAAAVGSGSLGTQGTLATTTGTLLFDEFVNDDTQVFGFERRWSDTILLTKSGHAFVGNGKIMNITLLSGATTGDDTLELHDSDTATTDDLKTRLQATAATETVDPAGMPVWVTNGAYVSLGGTDPNRALVQIGKAVAWGSEGAVRSYAARGR